MGTATRERMGMAIQMYPISPCSYSLKATLTERVTLQITGFFEDRVNY